MAMTETTLEGPHWTLLLDREITRRKIYHQVIDPRGLAAFSSRWVTECMDYLANEGINVYEVRCSPHRSSLEIIFEHRMERLGPWPD